MNKFLSFGLVSIIIIIILHCWIPYIYMVYMIYIWYIYDIWYIYGFIYRTKTFNKSFRNGIFIYFVWKCSGENFVQALESVFFNIWRFFMLKRDHIPSISLKAVVQKFYFRWAEVLTRHNRLKFFSCNCNLIFYKNHAKMLNWRAEVLHIIDPINALKIILTF